MAVTSLQTGFHMVSSVIVDRDEHQRLLEADRFLMQPDVQAMTSPQHPASDSKQLSGEQFWNLYLHEHQRSANRWLHVFGVRR